MLPPDQSYAARVVANYILLTFKARPSASKDKKADRSVQVCTAPQHSPTIRLQHSSCSVDTGASIVNNRSDRWDCQRTDSAGVGVFTSRRFLDQSFGSAGVLLTLHRSTRQTEPMSYGCQQLGLLRPWNCVQSILYGKSTSRSCV